MKPGNRDYKTDIGLLIFRVGAALLILLLHGIGKVGLLFGSEEIHFLNPLGLGEITSLVLSTVAEFVCALLIIAGLRTRLAAFILALNMGVAAFIQHYGMAFSENIKQLDVLFFLSFILLILLGGGQYSIDALINKRSKRIF